MNIRHRLQRLAYRRYRAAKQFFIGRPPGTLSRLFFWLLSGASSLTSGRRLTDWDRMERRIWKAIYFQRFGTEPLFSVKTASPIAKASADHVWPRGAAFDNSTNRNFNLKLYAFFDSRPDLRVLDLGCSGGGFVKSILEDGYTAVGLEGSDVSKKLRSGEWDTCPLHLLTCDITSDFAVLRRDGPPIQCHCVTAWEVLEHIPADKLPKLIDNIARHLTPDGIFVASVDMAPDANPVTGAVYHLTLQSKAWWLEQFAKKGFQEVKAHPFETRDYVRGHGMGLTDWDPADGEGFHLVLRKSAETGP